MFCWTSPPPEIIELTQSFDFQIVSEFKLLGLIIDAKLANLGQNIEKVIIKLNKLCNFWLLFNPSLPGRVNLAKCYLYSQLSYTCSIIEPSPAQMKEIEDIIYKFVKQSDIVSRSKIFSDKNEGGLGLPPVDIFIKSLDILLFKKGLHISDTWTHEIFFHCNNSDRYFFTKLPDKNVNPIGHRIVKNYMIFSENFWIKKGNVLDLRIFNNPNFINIFGQKLSLNFLDDVHKNNPIICNQFMKLRFKDILSADFKPLINKQQYCTKFGFVLTQNEFMHLDSIVNQNFLKRRTEIAGKN